MFRPRRSRLALSIAAFVAAIVVGGVARADSLTVAWDPDTDPTVVGYVVWVGTASNTYTRTFDVATNTSFVLTDAVAGQQYFFRVVAYAPGPLLGTPSVEVSGYSNAPPLLAAPGDQNSTIGVSASLQLTGSDPEGASLWFNASGLPAGLSINSSTGLIAGVPTTAGTYTVTATVSDGVLTTSQMFTWTVTGIAATPVTLLSPLGTITTTTPDFTWSGVTGAASYLLEVRNSTGQILISATTQPSAAGCGTGGTCRVSPGVVLPAGTSTWQVETITSTGATAWSSPGSFTVPQPLDTTAPFIAITTPTSSSTFGTTSSSVTIAGTASDNIGVVSVTWVSNAGSGTASGTTAWTAIVPLLLGTNSVIVSARDAAGNSSAAMLTVAYSLPDTTPPTVTVVTPTLKSSYNTSASFITLGGTASDNSGTVVAVTWSTDQGASGIAVGTSSWTADVPLALGGNVVTITARDGAGNTGTDVLTIHRSRAKN